MSLSVDRRLNRAFERVLPPARLNVAEYAAAYRQLKNEGGGYVGPWKHDYAPYLTEPQTLLTSLDYSTVCVVGPGQSGKTSIAENWLLQGIAQRPANMLWYMQTDEARKDVTRQ